MTHNRNTSATRVVDHFTQTTTVPAASGGTQTQSRPPFFLFSAAPYSVSRRIVFMLSLVLVALGTASACSSSTPGPKTPTPTSPPSTETATTLRPQPGSPVDKLNPTSVPPAPDGYCALVSSFQQSKNVFIATKEGLPQAVAAAEAASAAAPEAHKILWDFEVSSLKSAGTGSHYIPGIVPPAAIAAVGELKAQCGVDVLRQT